MPADSLARAAARAGNALRRLAAGLPARGGVSPAAPNDLFVAHLAAYRLAARYAGGRRVLDLGTGTGYGAAELARAGAEEVVGLDPDARSLAYAGKRFGGPRVRFVAGRAEDPPRPLGEAPFGLVVAANLLAHLADPAAAIDGARRALAADGVFLATVPPIVDDKMMEQQRAGGVHRANRYLWDWERLFRPRFRDLRLYRLAAPPGEPIDLADPRRSRLRAEDFRWDEVSLAVPSGLGTLAAAFVAGSPTL
ncbi:MAG TPA: class I SAM-dependent methyltransferase [Thermoanaerobaculia bacterium]|jgi:SAM-dependent methyltransferase